MEQDQETRRRDATLAFMARVAQVHADRAKTATERREHLTNVRTYEGAMSPFVHRALANTLPAKETTR